MSELAADGIPVVVSLRVLKVSRQPYYRCLATPVTDAEVVEAHRANALFDAHRDDPEFGYRFLADEARDAGQPMCRRTAWRICSENRWWSAFGKKKARSGKKSGPPVHDDLVNRDFSAEVPNELWLGDITEHRTREGKLYVCAIKDVFSNRIVGYSIDDRMKSRIAVNAIESAVARRETWPDACSIRTVDRDFVPGSSSGRSTGTAWSAPWAGWEPPGTTRRWRASSACCRRTCSTGVSGTPERSCASPS